MHPWKLLCGFNLTRCSKVITLILFPSLSFCQPTLFSFGWIQVINAELNAYNAYKINSSLLIPEQPAGNPSLGQSLQTAWQAKISVLKQRMNAV